MNRERAPFVLTPDFEYVMGKRVSESYKICSSRPFLFTCVVIMVAALRHFQEV